LSLSSLITFIAPATAYAAVAFSAAVATTATAVAAVVAIVAITVAITVAATTTIATTAAVVDCYVFLAPCSISMEPVVGGVAHYPINGVSEAVV
jgi:hypothetical protein